MKTRFLFLPLLVLTSCGSEAVNTAEAAQSTKAAPKAPKSPAKPEGGALDKSDALVEFRYRWPTEAAAIPALDGALRDKAEARLAELQTAASEQGGGQPLAQETEWIVAGETARFLSLISKSYVSTGGPHPNTEYDDMLWDKNAGKTILLSNLFGSGPPGRISMLDSGSSIEAMTELKELLCPLVEVARAERVQGEAPAEIECPYPGNFAVIDTNGDGGFDAFRVFLMAGQSVPQAEGGYEIDVPISDSIKARMRPDYQSSFQTD